MNTVVKLSIIIYGALILIACSSNISELEQAAKLTLSALKKNDVSIMTPMNVSVNDLYKSLELLKKCNLKSYIEVKKVYDEKGVKNIVENNHIRANKKLFILARKRLSEEEWKSVTFVSSGKKDSKLDCGIEYIHYHFTAITNTKILYFNLRLIRLDDRLVLGKGPHMK